MTEPTNKEREAERIAYNLIGPVIENKIQGNKGEDGTIVVDYAELRDALAELFLQHTAAEHRLFAERVLAEIGEDEVVPEFSQDILSWNQMRLQSSAIASNTLRVELRRRIAAIASQLSGGGQQTDG